jgi:hypothetical protein
MPATDITDAAPRVEATVEEHRNVLASTDRASRTAAIRLFFHRNALFDDDDSPEFRRLKPLLRPAAKRCSSKRSESAQAGHEGAAVHRIDDLIRPSSVLELNRDILQSA